MVPLRGLSRYLGDLLAWTLRREPEGFVLPQVYVDRESREHKREALVGGVEGALAAVDELTPDDCGGLDGDVSEALALAIILQAYEFFQSGGWDGVERERLSWALSRLEHTQALAGPLGVKLASEPDEALRASILRKLESTATHLNQVVKEGQELLAEQEVDPDSDEHEDLPSFDPVPDEHETPSASDVRSTPSASDVRSDRREEPLGIVLAQSRSRERRTKRAEAKRQSAHARLRRAIRISGFALIPVLAALALFSLRPLLPGGKAPRVDKYADLLPIQHVIRIQDSDEAIFIVSPSWTSLEQERQLNDLTALYERANEVEAADSIVIRDTQGRDLARVEEGVPVLLP